MPYGTFSAWLTGTNAASLQRLSEFYELNPEKVPRYIYVPHDSEWDMTWLNSYLGSKGYSSVQTAAGYAFENEAAVW
jgi:hypothetical protein